jgi:hypothetical protein
LFLLLSLAQAQACVEAPTPWVPSSDGLAAEVTDSLISPDAVIPDVEATELIAEIDSTVTCQPDCIEAKCGVEDGCGGYCYNLSSCDDSTDCTLDFCLPEDGGCVHIADHAVCDDGNPCTTLLCTEEAGCTETALDGPCNDGDLCTGDDLCVDTVCTGTPIEETACADGNPCTEDQCQPAKGCVHLPAEGECGVADGALPGECQTGVCVPLLVLQAPCVKIQDCSVFNSENLCSGSFICGDNGMCQLDPESIPDCEKNQDTACTKNRCNPETGDCEMSPEADELPCEDGDSCTLNDICDSGSCTIGDGSVACDDLNPCTTDSCLPESGCAHDPVSGECNDDNPCTHSDSCIAGYCVGTPYSCDDGLACTPDLCLGDGSCQPPEPDEKWCVVDDVCLADGSHDPDNWCRICDAEADGWSLSDVVFGTECPSLNAVGQCIQGECKNITCSPGFLTCDDDVTNGCEVDGNTDFANCGTCEFECALDEVCVGGDCLDSCPDTGHVPCGGTCPDHDTDPMHCGDCDVECLVPEPAFVGACVVGDCESASCPENQWDFDGSPKNGCEYDCQVSGEEVCDGADNDCDSFLDEDTCDDSVACTVDSCNVQLGCQHTPADQFCDDGNPCTKGTCDPQDDCSFTGIEGECDDGNPCTSDDQCLDAVCAGQEVADCCLEDEDCNDGNMCTTDICDPETHVCTWFSGPMDLEPCDHDSDGCSLDLCLDGVCVEGAAAECPPAGEACKQSACLSVGPFDYLCEVEALPEGSLCDDGLFCTVGESCDAAGECTEGVERDCSEGLGTCLEIGCDDDEDKCTGTPVVDGTKCDADGDGCTEGDECQQGLCFPGSASVCPGDPANCLTGICVSEGPEEYTCITGPALEGTLCDDGLPCTVGEFCNISGECETGIVKTCEPSGIPCVESECDDESGDCVLVPSAPGTVCDDANPCTMVDGCQSGQCVGTEDGCVQRKLNSNSKLVTFFPRPELQQTRHLGFGRTVTVWRAGDNDLRGQLLDNEGTKLLPDLPLTTDQWPPEPGNCGRKLTRPAVAVRANGDWIVVAGYAWRKMHYSGCGSSWYNRKCNFNFYYGLGYAVFDRHGNMTQDWVPVITEKVLWSYNTAYWGCNCGCDTGGHMPALVALAHDHLSALAFTDGSFAIVQQVDSGETVLRRITSLLEPGTVVTIGTMDKPSACALEDDTMVVTYEQSGQVFFRLFDKSGSALGEATPVSDVEDGHQQQALCRALPGGDFLVAFNSGYDGGGGDVYVSRFGASGTGQGTAVQINQATDGMQSASTAPAPLNDGGLMAVWHDDVSGGKGSTVKGRSYQDDLTPAGSEFPLGDASVGGDYLVVAESMGNEWLGTWVSPVQGDTHDVYFGRYDAGGAPSPGALEHRVGTATAQDQGAGTVAALAGGGLAITWEFENGGPQDTDIALRTFTMAGAGATPVTVANQTTQGLQYGAAVARDPVANRLLVAWTTLGQFDGEDVVGRFFDASGEPAGDEFGINLEIADGQYGVALAALGDGTVAAAWAGDSGTEDGTDVYVRLFDNQAVPVTDDQSLAEDNAGEQGNVTLASVTEEGTVLLAAAWSTAVGGDSGGVFARLFDASGTPQTGAVHVATGASSDQVAMAGQAGNYLVCWRAGSELLCRRLVSGLVPVGEHFTVENIGTPTRPALLFRNDNEVWVSCARSGADVEGDGIYRHHIDLSGNEKSPAALLNWRETGDQQFPFAAALATGSAVVGWTGSGEQGRELYFRILE